MLFTVVVRTALWWSAREREAVRSGTSVNNRPFLCRPSMGKSSIHGEFCGRTGHQRVSQLYSCGPTAEGLSINTMLWGMETQLCTVRVDGQDAETGLFTPVLQHPNSFYGHARGESVLPGGDSFPLSRDSGSGAEAGCVCCAPSAQRQLYLFHVLPGFRKTGEFRPMLDLHGLNRHFSCRKFRMVTMKQLLGLYSQAIGSPPST